MYPCYQFGVFGGEFGEPLVVLQNCDDRHQIPAVKKTPNIKQKNLTDSAVSHYILWITCDNKKKLSETIESKIK